MVSAMAEHGYRPAKNLRSQDIQGSDREMRMKSTMNFFTAAAGMLLVPTTAAMAQGISMFAEPSGHSAHLLYTEGSVSSSTNFGQPGAFTLASVSEPAVPNFVGEGLGDKAFSGVTRALPTGGPTMKPFRTYAVSVKLGTMGPGVDLATPLAQRLNLRAGASFFQYSPSFTTDGLNIDGQLKLQNAFAGVDIFPFNNSFRITPGLTFKNNNSMNANLLVPGGGTFSLGDADYTSDPVDPIHGTAAFTFGTSNIAPRLTMGFGNMLPRSGRHFSVPVEFGFQYISQPIVKLTFAGSGCSSQKQPDGTTAYGCGPVEQSDVMNEQKELQNDLSPLRFYPIFSIGFSYRIGGSKNY
jgi:hypothetical protein